MIRLFIYREVDDFDDDETNRLCLLSQTADPIKASPEGLATPAGGVVSGGSDGGGAGLGDAAVAGFLVEAATFLVGGSKVFEDESIRHCDWW